MIPCMSNLKVLSLVIRWYSYASHHLAIAIDLGANLWRKSKPVHPPPPNEKNKFHQPCPNEKCRVYETCDRKQTKEDEDQPSNEGNYRMFNHPGDILLKTTINLPRFHVAAGEKRQWGHEHNRYTPNSKHEDSHMSQHSFEDSWHFAIVFFDRRSNQRVPPYGRGSRLFAHLVTILPCLFVY